jgi:hypothetical protein
MKVKNNRLYIYKLVMDSNIMIPAASVATSFCLTTLTLSKSSEKIDRGVPNSI